MVFPILPCPMIEAGYYQEIAEDTHLRPTEAYQQAIKSTEGRMLLQRIAGKCTRSGCWCEYNQAIEKDLVITTVFDHPTEP